MMNVLSLYMNKKFNRKLCMYAFAGGGWCWGSGERRASHCSNNEN